MSFPRTREPRRDRADGAKSSSSLCEGDAERSERRGCPEGQGRGVIPANAGNTDFKLPPTFPKIPQTAPLNISLYLFNPLNYTKAVIRITTR